MALMVYATKSCQDDAREHGMVSELASFVERVEASQSLSLFDPFPPPYHVKKKFGGRQGRLVVEVRAVGEHAVVILLAVLIRGHHAYDREFSQDPVGYGRRHFADAVTASALAEFVDHRTRVTPPPAKAEPSTVEYGFLYDTFAHHENSAGDLVCETQDWIDQVSTDRVAKQLVLVADACLDALARPEGLHYVEVAKSGWGVWALRTPGRLVLLTLTTDATAVESKAGAERLASQLQTGDPTTILRSSRRAYPALILADSELWIDLELEPLGNMALSPEESEVLESARRAEGAFPLFINGRAGSGKSTVLQYIFADLLFFHLASDEQRVMAPPIYLTVNGELLRVARAFVERLLRSESTFTAIGGQDLAVRHRHVLDDAFRQFQPFLLSLLSQGDRLQRFGGGGRVDYARFRRMWAERFGKDVKALRECGPDLSWHVIRSYIKGMSSETYLEPDDYAQLPENQVSVPREAFELVYRRVWEGWYQPELERRGLWDDQDLTRFVIDQGLAAPLYPAVVCDEAQDFTRLELDLLLRLNLFSNRAVPPNAICRVPFVFAGDPFQTLNPTGFRWDAIKASFVEKFVFELDPSRRSGRVDLNYRELQYNYRSTPQIVRFGNHVQAMRAALFPSADVRPQTPWTTQLQAPPIVWFRASDGGFWRKFSESQGFVVIVPCGDGEEAAFVEGDPVLHEHIRMEDGVPVNVLSASRAKGCEYPAVVVYGFGESPESVVVRSTLMEDEAAKEPAESLTLQYFVNRLYVAVSRPKRRLVIVDTEAGLERLWASAREVGAEIALLERVKNGREVWGDHIIGMTIGKPEDLVRESVGDPLENAKMFEADGLARQDAFLLRQAAQAYRSAGAQAKSRECRARAFEADGEWLQAGEAFLDADFVVPDAVRCLWRTGRDGWRRLAELLADRPEVQQEYVFRWARLAVHPTSALEAAELLDGFVYRLEDESFAHECGGDPLWTDAIGAVLRPYLEDKYFTPDGGVPWRRVSVALDGVRQKGVRVPSRVSAFASFGALDYARAVAFWEESSDARPLLYRRAKAQVTAYPEQIAALEAIDQWEGIVAEYQQRPDVALTTEQAIAVGQAFVRTDKLQAAYEVAWSNSLMPTMLNVALASRKRRDDELARSALLASVMFMVGSGWWDMVAAFADGGAFSPSPEWQAKELKEWVSKERMSLEVALVRALARSDGLVDASKGPKKRIGEFLKGRLRMSEGPWAKLEVAEIGASFERLGRIVDSLAYYEYVAAESIDAQARRFARVRRVVNKKRQIEYERSFTRENAKLRDMERDVSQALADLRIASTEDLPVFPSLPTLRSPFDERLLLAAPPQAAEETRPERPPATSGEALHEVVAGPFKLEISRRFRRCNITHIETMSTAFIKCNERKCGGEVQFVQADDESWECEEWAMIVRLPLGPDDALLICSRHLGVLLSEIL